MTAKILLTTLSLTTLALAPMIGCESDRHTVSEDSTTGLNLEASTNKVVVGETVTFVARTFDTYGRDAKIDWNATSGDLKTEQDGRVARVKFNEVGTYTVRATLMVDGRKIAEDVEEIRVSPVR